MIYLIRNADVFAPQPLGTQDVLVAGERILALGEGAQIAGAAVQEVDGSGCRLVPGFVDVLTHPSGGGGEGGAQNRTPPMSAQQFIEAGITAPVGALGTDSISRTLDDLYGTVMSLRRDGLRSFMFNGSYRVPPLTLTGDVARDMVLIEPLLGVGELAIADHRSAQPTALELRRIAADVMLGGTLSGKQGVVFVHVGDGARRLQVLRDALADSELPTRIFYPTHINRNRPLLEEGFDWLRQGGFIDLTATTLPEFVEQGEVPVLDALQEAMERGLPVENMSFSTDAGGSLPVYRDGELVGLQAAGAGALLETLQAAAEQDKLFSTALAAVTRNPARALGLEGLGVIAAGAQADLVLLEQDGLGPRAVMCAGKWLQGGPAVE